MHRGSGEQWAGFLSSICLGIWCILVSQDPVALDYIGWQIIEKRRMEIGLKPLKAVGREPKYILTAARLKLGNIDEKYIRKIEI